mmetsp:Transcript_18899/g.21086  ORF Transcript_18899/g.21086 Transcript_18899/m.21086 type:complete len:714 (+) Transcript_18899:99-2240(+)|eukprot:CAMPEP_0194132170 /NCGR_PEP_ID=MMETSP0152-20130528/2703_1 /TAXON_ID=1049557 /ORGANISM="Thalassiothrix antarctica, Strain L6-D1" /LENGTH=713 /DNA_ID=CAMNT_0038827131 /DNA_START=73 /DNA_END=2214 /DNA_ORIENTATION=+
MKRKSEFKKGSTIVNTEEDESLATPPRFLSTQESDFNDESRHTSVSVLDHHPPRNQSCGRGIYYDYKNTIGKWWCKEMCNFSTKTIAVSLFLFIAVIAPSITFGAVYAKRTNNYMGAVELLLGTAWCGIFYSLVAGMPMMINGGTGPVLTFQAVTYELAKTWDVPFLTFNAWIGLWVTFYMLVSAFFDLNRFIRYATRFTDEIFAFLIISIFILDAIGNPASNVGLMHYFNPNHNHHLDTIDEFESENPGDDYDYLTVAFLSLLLGLGTCFFALILRGIKHSPFCCNDAIRSAVTDFAITISVVSFTLVKQVLFEEVPTEELNVPDSFGTTFKCCDEKCTKYFPDDCPTQTEAFGRRPWLVNLWDLNGKGWVVIVAAGPAALAFILAFLDNGITWHIINHPSNKVAHGDAYNYDTCVSAFMIAVNSLLGLPWLVASTVPCMMHVSAMSEKTKEGEVLSVQESRLTGFLTHILVLLSLLFLGIIKLIPLAVLYGVFLFMGLVALPAQQFWQRILLFFMQPIKYPRTPFTVFTKSNRIHLYTAIQIGFFAALYSVKTIKKIAIVFPFFILLCIPARMYLLPRIFEAFELVTLDGSPEEVEEFLAEKAKEEDNKILVDKEEDNSGNDDDVREEDDEDANDIPTPLVSSEPLIQRNKNNTTTIDTTADTAVLPDDHGYTQENIDAAHRRSGRRKMRTLSDLSDNMLTPPLETNWSHV